MGSSGPGWKFVLEEQVSCQHGWCNQKEMWILSFWVGVFLAIRFSSESEVESKNIGEQEKDLLHYSLCWTFVLWTTHQVRKLWSLLKEQTSTQEKDKRKVDLWLSKPETGASGR